MAFFELNFIFWVLIFIERQRIKANEFREEKKYYFRITFCSNLMLNRDINGLKLVCVGVEFLAFNILLRIKFEQKSDK